MSKKQKQRLRRGFALSLVLLLAVWGIALLFSALHSSDEHVQELIEKIVIIGGLGAVIAMVFVSLTRFEEPRRR